MDIESVRYLLSALVQAVATSWVIVLAVHVFLERSSKDRFADMLPDDFFERLKEGKHKLTSKMLFGVPNYAVYLLITVSVLAVLSILAATLGLYLLSESGTLDFSFVKLTVLLSSLTFVLLAILVIAEVLTTSRVFEEETEEEE